ncbi:unnamed protein product [Porites lobata]|uniref:HAT C-terminal dimerisation domain-containing protein n=1 Tax=Porites lobata TaxID=104759 RepID=A0ABN8R6N2_9CNID|nr:unnamed protein product [Porites lobata]
MSFGSDGASIMTVGGVSTLLKKENPFMINTHCMAQCLALCTSQAANQVEKMEKYRQLLTDLYYYFSKSAKRVAGLNAIQEILDSPQLKIKEMHSVRWFAFYSALETVYRSWDALVTYFADHKNDAKAACIPTTLGEIAKVNEGSGYYIKKLEESLKQDESEKWHMGAGGHEISYSETQKAQAIKSRDAFIDNLTEQITARFPQESQALADAFAILSLRGVSFMTAEDLSHYGNNKLLKLLNHYGSDKANVVRRRVIPAVVDPMKTKMEWSLLKDVVQEQQYPTGKLSMLWSCIFKFHPDTFPNLLKLVQLALTLPLQTADVERGFSAQNLIKTAHRYRME